MMEKTWRWFGKKDPITLSMLRQIGVEGIVTALHDVPNGEVWTEEAIRDLQSYIEAHGLRWSVVESLPVCEAIKYAGPEREQLIENYKVSLANLGRCGVKTVCYNFMPVIDWVRTDLQHPWPDGTSSLYYDRIRFAYFDTKILARPGAEADYTEEELRRVAELDRTIAEAEKDELVDTIIVKTQGFVNGNIREGDKNPVAIFRRLLAQYEGIDRAALRENMRYFLAAIMPVCEEYGVNMCVHPDDPPFQILGLPRIVTNEEDIRWFLEAVDNPHNGVTFCSGSYGTNLENDLPDMIRSLKGRLHFAHVRNLKFNSPTDFEESAHLSRDGSFDMYEIMLALYDIGFDGPIRPDHGRMIWDEQAMPGYGLYDRALGAAYLNGLWEAIEKQHKKA